MLAPNPLLLWSLSTLSTRPWLLAQFVLMSYYTCRADIHSAKWSIALYIHPAFELHCLPVSVLVTPCVLIDCRLVVLSQISLAQSSSF